LITYGVPACSWRVVGLAGCMRYPDGGGLTAAGRARREDVRLQAAGVFEQDVSAAQVAHELRVSTKSAYQWRRRWRAGGEAALVSKGPGGMLCRLSGAQLARLRAALEGGPAAWGWDEDQRWTLSSTGTRGPAATKPAHDGSTNAPGSPATRKLPWSASEMRLPY
jgi:hypothetical protein